MAPCMALAIRFAGPGDAETIHRLIRGLAAYERAPQAVEVTPGTLRRQLAGTPAPFECLLAEEDGVACGFALFFQSYSTWLGRPGLWIEDLFVEEPYRRRGVGRALLAELARIAVARGYGRMEWAVLDWNRPAWAFYRSLGAEPLEEWTTHRLGEAGIRALAAERRTAE